VDTLPPATQTGANTFGCLIDGVAFINTEQYIYNQWNCKNGNEIIKKNNPLVIYSGRCKFNGNNYSNPEIYIYLYDIIKVGNFIMADKSVGGLYNYIDVSILANQTVTQETYTTSHLNNFNFAITKFSGGVISGTFSGKLYSRYSNNTISITDGRFDLPY
jgi:hypothetical protein